MIGSIPQPLTETFETLRNDVSWLHAKLQIYKQLYKVNQATLDLLNDTAPSFFIILERTLRDDIVLSISRLTDPLQSMGKDNMVLRQIASYLDDSTPTEAAFKHQIEGIVDKIVNNSKPLRDLRNRKIAHRDFLTAVNRPVNPLPITTLDMTDQILEQIRNLMNKVEGHFTSSETHYEKVIMRGDAADLIFFLKKAKK